MKHSKLLYDFYIERSYIPFTTASGLNMNFIIRGVNADNNLQDISTVINNLYKKFIIPIKEDGELRAYIDYNTPKSSRNLSYKLTNEILQKTLKVLCDKNTCQFTLSKYKMIDTDYYGECYGEIDFKNYKYYLNDNEYIRYELVLSIPYNRYSQMPKSTKDDLLLTLKENFCYLNAVNAIATFYRNYEDNYRHSFIKKTNINKDEGNDIYGCHWCNMLCDKLVTKLGGIDNIKKELGTKYIVEEHISKNGDLSVFIQLSSDFTEMEQEDLHRLKKLFLPLMPKANKEKIGLSKRILETLQEGSLAYKGHLDVIEREEFEVKYILLLEEDDPRWN